MQIRPVVLFIGAVALGLAGCDDPTALIDEVNGCRTVETIAIGDAPMGALTEQDCTLEELPADYYAFETDGATVTITLTPEQGNAFRPYLGLVDGSSELVGEAVGLDTEEISLTEDLDAGVYAIMVISTQGLGSYELRLE